MRPRRRLLARLKALAALSVTLVVLGEVPGAWGGIIMTTAGGMTVGDGGPATHAVLNFPYSVAVDAAGNLFIADAANNRIRRVAASTGIITTFAGTGGTGFFGDGGPATSAQLWNPTGVAVDAAGNLFIADASNDRIRRVAAGTGIITTVAGTGVAGFGGDGGAGTSAQLWNPTGVAVDAAGNLFIADADNNRVRRVAAGTGIITTVAGTGDGGFGGDGGAATSAQLWIPIGVAVDAAGDLFIADAQNNRIRQVVAGSRIITTVAGTGDAGFGGDAGPAISAQLWIPTGVAVDAASNLFIADAANNRVRRVATGTGTITTVAGTGDFGFLGDGGSATSAQLWIPTGVAVDASGNLFIADAANSRIRKVAAASGIITTVAGSSGGSLDDGSPATSAQLQTPTGVAVDAAGNLFIADADDNRIRQVTAATGIITTAAGTGGPGFSGDGGPATSVQLSTPTGVAIDAAGNLFIADADDHRIRQVAPGGNISTVAGTGTAGFFGDDGLATTAQLQTPTGVAVDAAGNLFIADADNNRIRRVAVDTGIITTVAGTGQAGFSGDGDAATNAQLRTPTGIAVDAAGNLFIADAANNRIRRVAADGIITTFTGTGVAGFNGDEGEATAAELNFPYYVALDAAGNLYIADQGNFRIRQVAADGIITTVAGTGHAGFSGDGDSATSARLSVPYGVALDAAGNLFIADQGNFRVRQVAVDTGIITTVAGTGTHGFSGDGGPATDAQLSVSYGVALDAAGNLFISDTGNKRVRAVDLAASALPPLITLADEINATFTFVSAEPGVVRFSCQLDAGGFTPCTSPQGYPEPPAVGEHTFRVTATNQFGHTSPPSTYTWTTTTPIFRLTVAKQGKGRGDVDSSPPGISCGETCAVNYERGTLVTLAATPHTGSAFTGWSGGGCSGADTCSVTIEATTAVTAAFNTVFALTVRVTGTGGGTVVSSPAGISCDVGCTETFVSGTVVTLTASPGEGSAFVGWSGGGCSGTTPCVVTMTAETFVIATFAPTFVLTVSTAGAGAGTVTSAPPGIDCGSTCSARFANEATVTLTANPAPGSVFTGWSGGGCAGTAPCVVAMTTETSITATFTRTFVLTVSAAGAGVGTVTSSPTSITCGAICSAAYASGTVVTLTATPGANSFFAGWSGGGCAGTAPCTLTLGGATVVTATFDVTRPFTFTDPDLSSGFSIIKAVHILELREAINTARINRGLRAISFTDPNLTGGSTTIQAVHIAELRAALDEAYAAGGTYTDPGLGVETTVVKAMHIRELRLAVQALP